VSAQLAKVAAQSARELRDERLATASSGKGARAKAAVPAARASKKAGKTKGKPAAKRQTPISKRASASSRASTRRHQAKRASR